MKLELEFGDAYCYTPKFKINGVKANSNDFGEQYDRAPHDGDDTGCDRAYPCGNMQFTRKAAGAPILSKYGITAPEYELIAGQLEAGLSFGECGWCV